MHNRNNQLAPCGVLCAACPSFQKSCHGCSSENKKQKRISKWSCKIRKCCYEKMKIDHCSLCSEFPCVTINKLIKSHKEDDRFRYRHEIPKDAERIKLLGVDEFITLKKIDYTCKYCGGSAYFYYYKCNQCGKKIDKEFS